MYVSIYLSIFLSICLYIYLSFCLFIPPYLSLSLIQLFSLLLSAGIKAFLGKRKKSWGEKQQQYLFLFKCSQMSKAGEIGLAWVLHFHHCRFLSLSLSLSYRFSVTLSLYLYFSLIICECVYVYVHMKEHSNSENKTYADLCPLC